MTYKTVKLNQSIFKQDGRDKLDKFDMCICGNGMVGSAAALAFAKMGWQVAWIAPQALLPFSQDDLPDIRMSAISTGSIDVLKQINVWDRITSMRSRPYAHLRAWEVEGIETVFSANHIGEECLGHFVENRLIQLACADEAKRYSNLQIFTSAVSHILNHDEAVSVFLDDEKRITASIVLGAEGADSKVRKSMGIGTRAWQYSQQAMGVIVELSEPAANETWQQFLPSGPRSLLPMHDQYAALIWYDRPEVLNSIMRMSDEETLTAIGEAFPQRLPSLLRCLEKAQFPLTRMHAEHYVKDRVILAGDAAHTVNPLAGQGVNMGFGDIRVITNVFSTLCHFDESKVNSYLQQLKRDYGIVHKRRNSVMMASLEGIYHTFKQSNFPMKALRNLGMFAAQNSGFAKQQVIKFAAGMY